MSIVLVLWLAALLAGCVPTADFVNLRAEVRKLQADQGRTAQQDDVRKKLELLDAKIAALQAMQQDLAQKLAAMQRPADEQETSKPVAPVVSKEPQSEAQAGASPLTGGSATQSAPTPTALYNQAYNDYLKGRYDLAIAGFGDLLKRFPDSSRSGHAQYWIGRSHFNNKDYRRAIETYERAIADYPKSDKTPAVLFEAGVAYAELGEIVKAKERFRQTMDQYPQSNEAGRARLKLADLE